MTYNSQIVVIYAEKSFTGLVPAIYIGKIIKLNLTVSKFIFAHFKINKKIQDSKSHFFLSSQVLDNL